MALSSLPKTRKLVRVAAVAATILVVVALAIAGTPGSPGDTTADFVLGQIDFVHRAPQFVTAKSLDFGNGGHIAIDANSSPNHLYVSDASNNPILAWNDAESLTNGQAADLLIGQPHQ